MKFKEVKIGQSFNWNQNRFVKCGASVAYCDKANSNGLPYLESFLDKMDIEVELVSKCENCKHYGVLSGDCPVGPIEYYYVNTDEFSCSFFEEGNQ